jgi:hypothetical protein
LVRGRIPTLGTALPLRSAARDLLLDYHDSYESLGDIACIMLDFSFCQECQRRLRDAIFCPWCGQSSCSWKCHVQHVARHAGSFPTKDQATQEKIEDNPRTKEAAANFF